ELARDYPDLAGPDVQLVTTADGAVVRQWAKGAATDLPGVDSVQVERVGKVDGRPVLTVGLLTSDDVLGAAPRALVDRLHAEPPPFDASIGGQAAALSDLVARSSRARPGRS